MIDQDQFKDLNDDDDSKTFIYWWIFIALSALCSLLGLCFAISWILYAVGLPEYAPMALCGLSAPATLAFVKIL